jgi:hypothetical protein
MCACFHKQVFRYIQTMQSGRLVLKNSSIWYGFNTQGLYSEILSQKTKQQNKHKQTKKLEASFIYSL